jgi:hypothetical protein
MKKVFVLALAFAGLTTAVKAQKGSILVGGNIDFSSESQPTSPTTTTNTLGFNPTVGYQFSNHLTVGLTSDLSTQKESAGGNHASNNSFDLGPFIRYSKSLSDIFSIYGQLQGVYGSYKDQITDFPNTNEGNRVNVQLFPAVFVNLKNNFGLNFNIGGISYKTDLPKGGKSTNTFDINFGQTLSIGVSKNFGGKK